MIKYYTIFFLKKQIINLIVILLLPLLLEIYYFIGIGIILFRRVYLGKEFLLFRLNEVMGLT